jgi:hypothetical protein
MATRDVSDDRTRGLSRHPLWWTGDVWKVVPILRHYRPDLHVTVFDSSPTGLAVVTGLNPANHTLSEHYAEILMANGDCAWHEEGFSAYIANIELAPTSQLLDAMPSEGSGVDSHQ